MKGPGKGRFVGIDGFLLFGVSLAVIFWLLESAIHVYIFEGDFL
jgi:hypothetical protein